MNVKERRTLQHYQHFGTNLAKVAVRLSGEFLE